MASLNTDSMADALKATLQRQFEIVQEEFIEEATLQFSKKLRKRMALAAINIENFVDFLSNDHGITIRLRTEPVVIDE